MRVFQLTPSRLTIAKPPGKLQLFGDLNSFQKRDKRRQKKIEQRSDHFQHDKTAPQGRGLLEELIRIKSYLTQYAALNLARERLIERSTWGCPPGCNRVLRFLRACDRALRLLSSAALRGGLLFEIRSGLTIQELARSVKIFETTGEHIFVDHPTRARRSIPKTNMGARPLIGVCLPPSAAA